MGATSAVIAAAGVFEGLEPLIGSCFSRSEPRRHAIEYVRALISPIARKNGWQIAEGVGESTPYGKQQFLVRDKWSADEVCDRLKGFSVEELGSEESILILDETSFVKKGQKSAGVGKQYCGRLGKVENCQVGVFLCYSTRRGSVLIDRELYLQEEWTSDELRCVEAGVPDDREFYTKPQLGRLMLERTLEADVPCEWVLADALYGDNADLAGWLESLKMSFVMGVSSNRIFASARGRIKASDYAAGLQPGDWQLHSSGDGSKGPLLYDWHRIRLADSPISNMACWLLLRRSIDDPARVVFFLVHAAPDSTLERQIEIASRRWAIETCFEAAKGETGLHHYEVRKWHAWYRHITLSMFALTLLTVGRNQATEAEIKKGAGMILQPSNRMTAFRQSRGLALN